MIDGNQIAQNAKETALTITTTAQLCPAVGSDGRRNPRISAIIFNDSAETWYAKLAPAGASAPTITSSNYDIIIPTFDGYNAPIIENIGPELGIWILHAGSGNKSGRLKEFF